MSTTPSSDFGLNHVEVVTPDVDRITDFYVRVFDGVRVDVPVPPGAARAAVVRLGLRSGIAFVEVNSDHPDVEGSQAQLRRGHVDHLAIDAPTPEALEQARQRLVTHGAGDGALRDYGPMVCVSFHDPDGMASEVCWIRDPTLSDFHPPVAVDELDEVVPAG